MRLCPLALVLLMAACGTDGPSRGVETSAASPGQADFNAARPELRRVGFRDCNGVSMQLWVPRQVGAAADGQQIWWQIDQYGPGRYASLNLIAPTDFHAAAWRTQKLQGGRWGDIQRRSAAAEPDTRQTLSAGQLGRTWAMPLDLIGAIGVTPGIDPAGSYRVHSGSFVIGLPGGASCAMSPFWDFEIR